MPCLILFSGMHIQKDDTLLLQGFRILEKSENVNSNEGNLLATSLLCR